MKVHTEHKANTRKWKRDSVGRTHGKASEWRRQAGEVGR